MIQEMTVIICRTITTSIVSCIQERMIMIRFLGWMKQAPKNSVKKAKEYLRMTKEEGYNWGMMCGAWMSSANLAVVTMQDLIGLGSSARMNIPSTLGGNWTWRALPGQINAPLANKLHHKTELYGRLRR